MSHRSHSDIYGKLIDWSRFFNPTLHLHAGGQKAGSKKGKFMIRRALDGMLVTFDKRSCLPFTEPQHGPSGRIGQAEAHLVKTG